jgi:sugar phosphate isomerase/epimerase
MKTALYTVTYNGQFYKGPPLSLEEIFSRVADMGFDAVEIGAKRPIGSPLDLDGDRRRAIRQLAADSGVEIGCIGGYSNLASPVLEQREAQLVMLRETIRLAADLRAPVVRVFAAWPGVTLRDGQSYYELAKSYKWHDVTWFEQWQWARQGLEEASRWAEECGVILALQNHKPVTNTYQDALAMVREIASPNVRACIDAPHLADQSDEGVRRAILDVGPLEVWSHFGGYQETPNRQIYEDTGEGVISVNYPAFFRALYEIKYEGAIAYEGCGPSLVRHEYQGVEEADRRVRLALAYMKRELAAAEAAMRTPASR